MQESVAAFVKVMSSGMKRKSNLFKMLSLDTNLCLHF